MHTPPAPLVASADSLTAVDEAVSSAIAELPSPESQRSYECVWRFCTHWLSGQRLAVTAVRPMHVQLYMAKLRDDGKKKGTISRALTVIRSMYGAIVRNELMPTNPAREVKAPKVDSTPKTPYIERDEDIKKLITVPASTWTEMRDRLIVRVAFGLGWRRSEVARVRIEDIDGRTITAPVIKGGKTITVGLPKKVAAAIAEWRAFSGINSGTLFPRRQDDARPINGAIVYRVVRQSCAKVGIAVVPPHALRRTYITKSGERDVPLKERQLSVGHSSSATTERYDRARDAARACPGDSFDDLFDACDVAVAEEEEIDREYVEPLQSVRT